MSATNIVTKEDILYFYTGITQEGVNKGKTEEQGRNDRKDCI